MFRHIPPFWRHDSPFFFFTPFASFPWPRPPPPSPVSTACSCLVIFEPLFANFGANPVPALSGWRKGGGAGGGAVSFSFHLLFLSFFFVCVCVPSFSAILDGRLRSLFLPALFIFNFLKRFFSFFSSFFFAVLPPSVNAHGRTAA